MFTLLLQIFYLKYYIIMIQLSKGWDPKNRFNPITSLRLISNTISRGTFVFKSLRWDVIGHFVNIGGFVEHWFVNFLFIKFMTKRKVDKWLNWLELCLFHSIFNTIFRYIVYVNCIGGGIRKTARTKLPIFFK